MTTTIKKQILIGARGLFAHPDTWIRGKSTNKTHTAWCLGGAITEAAMQLGLGVEHPDEQAGVALFFVNNILRKRCGLQSNSPANIPAYNDSPDTTFEDITNLLDDAIASCN